jgi:hypothetical protein
MTNVAFAEGPTTIWMKTFGGPEIDVGCSIQPLSNGGIIILGYTESINPGERDFWLINTDASGNEIWNKTYGGSDYDYGYSVQETKDGGFILLGGTWSFGAGLEDFWLIRTDSEGNEIWNKTYGGSGMEYPSSIQKTSDGGYIIIGSTESFGTSMSDLWLIKIDADGTELWNKTYGSSPWNEGYAAQQTSDGGYILLGTTDKRDTDFWLIKTDPNGNKLWDRTFGGNYSDIGYSLDQTIDGGFILSGTTTSFGSGRLGWLLKTDSDGNELWNQTFYPNDNDYRTQVVQTLNNRLLSLEVTSVLGAGDQDILLFEINSPPSPTKLQNPADGDTIPMSTVFEWETSIDPESDVVSYDLYIDTDSTFSEPLVISNIAETQYYYTGTLEDKTTYFWKVLAKDNLGASIWSQETFTFFVDRNTLWNLICATAYDGDIALPGIDNDDFVILSFDKPTDKPEINSSNIDSILMLNNDHSWLDGAGNIKECLWNITGEQLIVYLTTSFTPPTVSVEDTITPAYEGMGDSSIVIRGNFDPSLVSDNGNSPGCPRTMRLLPARPNPFNPVTQIFFDIPVEGRVTLSIFDIQGKLLRNLADEVMDIGTHSIVWNAEGASSGVYICRLEMPERGSVQTRKMLLLK